VILLLRLVDVPEALFVASDADRPRYGIQLVEKTIR